MANRGREWSGRKGNPLITCNFVECGLPCNIWGFLFLAENRDTHPDPIDKTRHNRSLMTWTITYINGEQVKKGTSLVKNRIKMYRGSPNYIPNIVGI